MKKISLTIILFACIVKLQAQAIVSLSTATNYGYTSGQLSNNNTTPAITSTNLLVTPNHVYYIGNNNKVCDCNYTGTAWQGGGQLDWDPVYVASGSKLINDGEDLYFVSNDGYIYEETWNSTTGWHPLKLSTSQTLKASGSNELVYSNNKLFYVSGNVTGAPSLSYKVCSFTRSGGVWTYDGALSSDPYTEPVATGTKMIYDGVKVFYIGQNTQRVHNYYPLTGGGWWEDILSSTIPTVATSTNLAYDGVDLYYVGTDKKIYRLYWNAGWNSVAISQANATKSFNLTYYDNHIFYEAYDGGGTPYILYQLERTGIGWTGMGTSMMASTTHNSDISVITNQIFHEGSLTSTFNSYQVSFVSYGHKIGYDILDYPLTDESKPLKWYVGGLGNTASIVPASAVAVVYHSGQKRFFYVGAGGYINYFTRKLNNNIARSGYGITYSQEFNASDPGLANLQTNWYSQWPWGSGPLLATSLASGGQISYDNYYNNCTVNNGNLTIANKQETSSLLEWGWTNPSTCQTTNYNYTSGQIYTGEQNPGYASCGPHNPEIFSQNGGLFEAKMKIPRGKDAWPAFWFWPDAGGPEIDFELGGNGKWLLCNTLGTSVKKWTLEQAVGYRFYDDFYTFSILVNSGTDIKWLLNNEQIVYENAPASVPMSNMYMLVTQAVVNFTSAGHKYPNQYADHEASIYPNYLDVDYIRAYQPVKSLWIDNKKNEDENSVSIYPNPANGIFNIELNNSDKTIMEVYDVLGNKVKSIEMVGHYTLDLSGYSKGIYMIKMTVNGQQINKKIILE